MFGQLPISSSKLTCLNVNTPQPEKSSSDTNKKINQIFYKNIRLVDLAEKYGTSGKGLIVFEDVAKGEILWSRIGDDKSWFTREQLHNLIQNRPKIAQMIIDFSCQSGEDLFTLPTAILTGEEIDLRQYINHSCDPNCGYWTDTEGKTYTVALRAISAGEELTKDYATLETEASFTYGLECKCGTEKCSGKWNFDLYRSSDAHAITMLSHSKPELIKKKNKMLTNEATMFDPSADSSKYEILRFMPKYNSHCHLGGEVPIETLKKYASKEQALALDQAISEIAVGKEYEKAFNIFPLISQIINTHEKMKEAAFQTCQRFKMDNVRAVLIRTGLKILEDRSYEDYLKTVLEGIQDSLSDEFTVFVMLSLKRSSTLEMARLTVDLAIKYQEKGVIGIDISDISIVGDIKTIIPELLRAKQNGLKLAVHMGESIKEQDQMLIMRELEPDLIDHGVNLCKEAVKLIKSRNLPVTVCLTSSIATKMHNPSELHPWITEYIEREHPIHLGTDDSTVFGNITLSNEYLRLISNMDLDKVIQLAKRSFEQSKEFFSRRNF